MDLPGYPARHVSVANARGADETNLPVLLRRVADMIEELNVSPTDVLDLTIDSEITENGPWWSATLYWSAD